MPRPMPVPDHKKSQPPCCASLARLTCLWGGDAGRGGWGQDEYRHKAAAIIITVRTGISFYGDLKTADYIPFRLM